MTMRISLDPGAFRPVREHSTDAGMDFFATEAAWVYRHSSQTFRTGVHVELPPNTAGVFISKSGLMVNHGITSTGLVDEGYNGEVVVKLFNHSDNDVYIPYGAKISQMVIVPVMYEPIEVVREINQNTERGNNGFGSTGLMSKEVSQ